MASNNKTLMPLCVATYARDHKECDGDAKGKTELEQMPCVWRDRCVSLGIYARKNRLERSQLVQLVKGKGKDKVTYAIAAGDDTELQAVMVEGIRKYRIKDGVAALAPLITARGIRPAKESISEPTSRPESKPKAKPAPDGEPAAKGVGPNVEGRRIVEEIGNHYQATMLSKLGRTMADSHGEAVPGQFFMVDRRERSGYCSLYVKSEDGKRIAVTSLYFKPNNEALEVRVAADYKLFSALLSAPNRVKLQPKDCTGQDGQFKVRFAKLDKMGAAIVAEALDRAAKAGILELPIVGS